MKKNKVQVASILLSLLVLVGCNQAVDATMIIDNEYEENELLFLTELDYSTSYTNPEFIDLEKVEGPLVIEEGGEYVLSGKTTHTIVINAHDEIVHLFFDNLSVETVVGSAINIISSGKVIITLLDETVNTLFDAAYYSENDVHGTISAECDLTINGSGIMYVCGYYKDAIYSKDVFKLVGGNVQLKAKRNGIRGNDGIMLYPEYLLIESEGNGCQTKNADKENKGALEVRGGEISIVAGKYGMYVASDLFIREGSVHINSVIEDVYTEGNQYIAEGAYIHE